MASDEEITIIGGSLAGLGLALACAMKGLAVRVFEQSEGHALGGDSLTVDLDLLAATTGYDPRATPALPVVPAYRDLTTWAALYGWLRGRVSDTPGIVIEGGRRATSIVEVDGSVSIAFAEGHQQTASVVIGADGYRSINRRAIAPEAPLRGMPAMSSGKDSLKSGC